MSALDKDLTKRVFYPLLLRYMLKCPFAESLTLFATSISVAYKALTFSEKLNLGIWCELSAIENKAWRLIWIVISHQMPSFIFSEKKKKKKKKKKKHLEMYLLLVL